MGNSGLQPVCKSRTPGPVFNCLTTEAWSEEKRAWCCEHEQRGCAGATLYLQNQICGRHRHVSSSLSVATNSPEKCMSYVLSECAHKEFFTWRSTNNACHCVNE